MDKQTETDIEAAVFRRLLEHLDSRKDAQNIDLMNLAGFCRNCLSKWYVTAANERGFEVKYETARERVYGMPYGEWKEKYQREATEEQKRQFDENFPKGS
jgi:hypothetical protein